MLISSYEEVRTLIDLNDESVPKKLRLEIEGKKVVHGDDYEDDTFYSIEKKEMLIDTENYLVYVQEDKDYVVVRKLLDKQILSVEENGEMLTFVDEFKFKGKIKDIKKLWEQKTQQ